MYRKHAYKLLFLTYQVVRSVRYGILSSVFGVVSHCKHTPTCGTYTLQMVKKEGLVKGLVKGAWKVARCW